MRDERMSAPGLPKTIEKVPHKPRVPRVVLAQVDESGNWNVVEDAHESRPILAEVVYGSRIPNENGLCNPPKMPCL